MKRFLLALAIAAAGASGQQPAQSGFVPSDELNKELPRWLRFSGDYRTRLEGFTGGGFKSDNKDAYLLNRFRINTLIQPVSWLKVYAQGQDARVFWKNQHPSAPPFQDTMDLRLAYLEIGETEKGSPDCAWAGRSWCSGSSGWWGMRTG